MLSLAQEKYGSYKNVANETQTSDTDTAPQIDTEEDHQEFISQTLIKYIVAGIEHQLIRPAASWHNGRVERSHRTDDKYFYSRLSFYSLEDLNNQGAVWRRKYQNVYQRKYNYLSPMEVWKIYKRTGKHPIYDDNLNSPVGQ